MNQTIRFFSCMLGIVCFCGGMSQVSAQMESVLMDGPVGEYLEMIVEMDGMKDEEGVRSVYPGDAVYLILSLKNISQIKVLEWISPAWKRGSDRGGIVKLRVPDDDLKYTFYREGNPPRDYIMYKGRMATPPPLLYPGKVRQMLVERIELPPLEDQKSPFWMTIREKLETEPFVECEMDVKLASGGSSTYSLEKSIPIRIYPRAALMPGTKTERREQGARETTMLDKWLEEVPAYFLPVENKYNGGRNLSREGDLAMFPPGAIPMRGDKKREEFSLLHTDLTRKPIYPNTPTTIEGWRELEQQFSPSTIRDEIQLRRMILERARAPEGEERDKKHQEIVTWLMTLPHAQRTIMADDFGIKLPEKDYR